MFRKMENFLDASLPNQFEGLNSAEDAEFQEVMLLVWLFHISG